VAVEPYLLLVTENPASSKGNGLLVRPNTSTSQINNQIYCQTTRRKLKVECYNLICICTNAVYSNSSVVFLEVFRETPRRTKPFRVRCCRSATELNIAFDLAKPNHNAELMIHILSSLFIPYPTPAKFV